MSGFIFLAFLTLPPLSQLSDSAMEKHKFVRRHSRKIICPQQSDFHNLRGGGKEERVSNLSNLTEVAAAAGINSKYP
jgi:hypothetical protein